MSFPQLTPLTEAVFSVPATAQRQSNLCSMVNFYPEAKRIMDAVCINHILEIGSEAGVNTLALLEYAKSRNAKLTTVDPVTIQFPFAVSGEKSFHFFQGTSQEFLSSKFSAEVIFMDGDHNYETVINDLENIHQNRAANKIKVMFLHDVSWPWARRDNYYDLSQISAPNPNYADTQVSPYISAKKFYLPPCGYTVATQEGGAKNGVLTAIEAFLKKNGTTWAFWHIPIIYGIGILCCTDNLNDEEYSAIKKFSDELLSHRDLLATLELNRIENLCLIQSLSDELKKAGMVWNNDQHYIEKANSSISELTAKYEFNAAQVNFLQSLMSEKEALIDALKASLESCAANESLQKDICRNLLQELTQIRAEYESEKAICSDLRTSGENLTRQNLVATKKIAEVEGMLLEQQETAKQLSESLFATETQLNAKNELIDSMRQEYDLLNRRCTEVEKEKDTLHSLLDIKSAEFAENISKLNQQEQLLARNREENNTLYNRIWQRDQALRRVYLEQLTERWRIKGFAIFRNLPYGLRNRKKLKRIAAFLTSKQINVLSLDVFDTLLLRRYHSESKRFWEIAKIFSKQYPAISQQAFYEARTIAHRLTYCSQKSVQGCREPKAAAIFQCLARITNLPQEAAVTLARLELQYEKNHLRSNPAICDIVRLAQQNNISVILISDMYWSGSEIKELLDDCLPKDLKIDSIYSSSDLGISKSAGFLFDYVIKQIQCSPEKILHLGDNNFSDCIVPYIQHGINAIWLPRASQYNSYCCWQQQHFMKKLHLRGVINGI